MLLPHVWGRRTTPNLTTSTSSLRQRLIHTSVFLGVFLLGTTLLLLSFRYFLVPLFVFYFPSLDSCFYDLGFYGIYPERHYHSFNLASPSPRTPNWDAHVCNQENESGGLVLVDLHGTGVTHRGPAILDLKGNLIWTDNSYGQHAMNTMVQEYKGEQYLTFWAGENERGNYYMLDSGFNLAYTISAMGENVWGDPHEFKITDNGTALILVYNRTIVDLTHTHMSHLNPPYIVDSVIQEIDIASGELQFEWRASDHSTPDDGEYLKYTYDTHLDPKHAGFIAGRWTEPHDYFHTNSVDKDSEGNYLVSIRHTHQVICISGTTGEILWGFGGRATDIEDLDDGTASDFRWQHDARWIDEENGILGVFDNGGTERHCDHTPYSRGRIIQLDVENKTARNLHSYASHDLLRATSQGSFQFLPRTNTTTRYFDSSVYVAGSRDQVFIGWGSAAAYSLHDAETEELLCETHFAASLFRYFEFAKSYRAIRVPKKWKARPEGWDPRAIVKGGKVYVSWNGGMEVRSWVLHGRDDKDRWEEIVTVPRQGFETAFELPKKGEGVPYSAYNIAALDGNGDVLRDSNVFEPPEETNFSPWKILLVGGAAATVLSVFFAFLRDQGVGIPDVWSMAARRRDGYRKLETESDCGSER